MGGTSCLQVRWTITMPRHIFIAAAGATVFTLSYCLDIFSHAVSTLTAEPAIQTITLLPNDVSCRSARFVALSGFDRELAALSCWVGNITEEPKLLRPESTVRGIIWLRLAYSCGRGCAVACRYGAQVKYLARWEPWWSCKS